MVLLIIGIVLFTLLTTVCIIDSVRDQKKLTEFKKFNQYIITRYE